ncbi:hypothetical protein [Bacillus velezensis]|uniref:hypothetical protein n=1 Tax=Bacillus velezensis TaxID=492670 RepID=UPI0009B02E92|nr:hypothetical protein [Bacillus velezensis]MEC1106378.1 hypothetical protein [Bacillus velezensis]OQC79877.1 hypothetical protein BKK82_06350 [Bacillus velezensis]
MGRGRSIQKAHIEVNGTLKSIYARDVTKIMKDRSQVFYCPNTNCNAKLSHNKGCGKNPKPYFFLRRLPNGKPNNHINGCSYLIPDEYVDVFEVNEKRTKYNEVKWVVPLEEEQTYFNNSGSYNTEISNRATITVNKSIKEITKPYIQKLISVRSFFTLKKELAAYDKEIQRKIYGELQDQCVLYLIQDRGKLSNDIENKKLGHAFYLLGYLWMSEWRHLKLANPYFLLRDANKDIIKCYIGKKTVKSDVGSITWELKKQIEAGTSEKRSVLVGVKATAIGKETIETFDGEAVVPTIKIYEIDTEFY